MKFVSKTIALMLAAVLASLSVVSCAKNKNLDMAIVSIGDQKITLGYFKAAFESYSDYYRNMGSEPYTNRAELNLFQDLILDAVIDDVLVLHHAEQEGFKLSPDARALTEQQAQSELDQIKREYTEQAEQLHASDSSKSVQQYFDQLMNELSLYYTGTAMSFDEYSARYMVEAVNTAIVEAYKKSFEDSCSVSDDEIRERFDALYEEDLKLYSDDPAKFYNDYINYEQFGDEYDFDPPVYVPEGYAWVYDIAVYPEGELGDEYRSMIDELDAIAEECAELLFADKLEGSNAHEAKIDELVSQYLQLEKSANEMFESYQGEARKKIDAAYDELSAGASFESVLKKYSEKTDLSGKIVTERLLISAVHDCADGSFSSIFKEVFSSTKSGEYSSVFSDEDGSLHIILNDGALKSGKVDLDSVKEPISRLLHKEQVEQSWKAVLEEWRGDDALKIDMDTVRSVGADSLAKEENE